MHADDIKLDLPAYKKPNSCYDHDGYHGENVPSPRLEENSILLAAFLVRRKCER